MLASANFPCLQPDCNKYLLLASAQGSEDELLVRQQRKKFGQHRNGLQRFGCLACNKTFTEDHNAAFRGEGYMKEPRASWQFSSLLEIDRFAPQIALPDCTETPFLGSWSPLASVARRLFWTLSQAVGR